jgi:hypothetical protein
MCVEPANQKTRSQLLLVLWFALVGRRTTNQRTGPGSEPDRTRPNQIGGFAGRSVDDRQLVVVLVVVVVRRRAYAVQQ